MKSPFNFAVKKENGLMYDMYELGVWVSYFHIYSPNVIIEKVTVPGMPGAHVTDIREDERKIAIELQLEAESIVKFDDLKHQIFNIFFSKEKLTIIRDMYPNQEIYAYLEGEYDIDNITDRDGNVPLTLTMPDPYKYGPEVSVKFTSDVFTLTNIGTAETPPMFELEVFKPVTFAMIQNQDNEYMMIGKPTDINSQVIDTKTLVLEERGETLNTWLKSPTTVDGGVVAGTFGSDNAGITVSDYGTGENWHGPALIKEIAPIDDFEVSLFCEVSQYMRNETFRIEYYLFDEYMNALGKMAIVDPSLEFYQIEGEGRYGGFTVGDHSNYPISSTNYKYTNWDYFNGLLRMKRIGNQFEFYIARIADDGTHYYIAKQTYTDTKKQYTGRVKYVQIHIGTYGDEGYPGQSGVQDYVRINSLKVYKLAKENKDQTPYIAYPNDIIKFDMKTKDILINGESRMDLKDFGATFFNLKKGDNQLVVMPRDSFRVKVSYRERYR
ncbi:phage tail domain-containing protein [Caldifermentibacillus hisashii]|uniref:phage distal tail protein n=1 Tax=Caldifermentibacillus hisashii TaxID=996558 RepID=UPI0031FD2B5C